MGTVTLDGSGLQAVTVGVSPAAQSTSTDSTGAYSFIPLSPGSYTVSISNAPAIAYCPTTSKSATVPQDTVIIVDFACVSSAQIVGSFSLNGAPFGNVPVVLSGPASANTSTDSGGDFGFSGLAPGSYSVAPGALPLGVTCVPATRAVSLAAGDVKRADFDCTNLGQVVGTVTLNGGAFPDVDVRISGTLADSTLTDSSGGFVFSSVPAGGVTVVLMGVDAAIACTPASHTGTVVGGQQLRLDFDCTASAAIIGTVTLDGSPYSGLVIDLVGPQTGSRSTGSSGGFLFAGLPAGSYAVAPTGLPADVVCTPASVSVSLVFGDLKRADFDCVRLGTVIATVTLNGGPFDGQDVQLTGTADLTRTTDSIGEASFLVPPGSVSVTLVGVPIGVTCTPSSRAATVLGGQIVRVSFACTTGPPPSSLDSDYEVGYALVSSTCGSGAPTSENVTVTTSGATVSIASGRLGAPVTAAYQAASGRAQGSTAWFDIGGGNQARESWDVFFSLSTLGRPVMAGTVIQEVRDSTGTITCTTRFRVLGLAF